ncbi:hypothetical protein [Exiguobacterium artemiae]|uniref:hypothetical protein n=1 Tax=Exiguobacterium artemiae TaxID=340145 RepID=UPI003D04D16E
MFKKTALVGLTASLFVTGLVPFSNVSAEETTSTTLPDNVIADDYIDPAILEAILASEGESFNQAYANDPSFVNTTSDETLTKNEPYLLYNGEPVPKNVTPPPPQVMTNDPGGNTSSWNRIYTGSKIITNSDFYAAGTIIAIESSIFGWSSVARSILASVFGVAYNSVPKALTGEKIHIVKDMKWIDKKKYIYDIRTVEYIERNGKRVNINSQVVREDGWGNG